MDDHFGEEKKWNTAESDPDVEAMYLRMLDQEVPDLWGRIEAGLNAGTGAGADRAEARNGSGQEARFLELVEREAENNGMEKPAGSGRNGRNGRSGRDGRRRKRPVFWIAGLAAAAALILISVFVFRIAGGREKTADHANGISEIAGPEVSNDSVSPSPDGAGNEQKENAVNSMDGTGKKAGEKSENRAADSDETAAAAEGDHFDREPAHEAVNEATHEAEETGTSPNAEDESDSGNTSNAGAQKYTLDVDRREGEARISLRNAGITDPIIYVNEIPLLGVTMELSEMTATGGKVTLRCSKRDTEYTVTGDLPFRIEEYKDGDWKQLQYLKNYGVGFQYKTGNLTGDGEYEQTLTWESYYGILAPGKYRIVKAVNCSEAVAGYESFCIAANFTIE